MSENKCCGNCRYFTNEDLDGFGFCDKIDSETHCTLHYDCHEGLNGWTEITPDNVDEVDWIPKDKVVIAWISNKEFHSCSLSCFWFTLKSIAMQGGFYYYVLPELKIE